jgi:hypothetical protein
VPWSLKFKSSLAENFEAMNQCLLWSESEHRVKPGVRQRRGIGFQR